MRNVEEVVSALRKKTPKPRISKTKWKIGSIGAKTTNSKTGLIEGAQLLHGLRLGQLQATGKILIRRHEGGVGLIVIVIFPGRAVLARPMMESKSKFGWYKDDPIGDCFVHKNPFPNAALCVCLIDPQPQPMR